MNNEVAVRRRRLTLVVVGLVVATGVVGGIYDTLSLAFVIAAAGLIWSSKDRNARLVAVALITAGLSWSSLDQDHCSAWYRGKILCKKLSGGLGSIDWGVVWRGSLGPCCGTRAPGPEELNRVGFLKDSVIDGRRCELFEMDLGQFWIPSPGQGLLALLRKEIAVDHIYDTGDIKILPGDTVIDCGAHVGVYTRYILKKELPSGGHRT